MTEALEDDKSLDFQVTIKDFGVSARYTADSFKGQEASEFSSSVYWNIAVETENLEEIE